VRNLGPIGSRVYVGVGSSLPVRRSFLRGLQGPQWSESDQEFRGGPFFEKCQERTSTTMQQRFGSYSTTASAMESTPDGTSMPRACAV
jgi:hypothetical protein